ncbi:hypothetical protein NDK47_04555 [Brevibacillus ruminantium]|uniref:Integral membrane protein n=1 Tax=Brevibacillus ruminantium TaxID=2950604 RepID=A0ABY4WHE8_9BACL|nr:hypothetical protein [Brevibacillus ruminantium]USG66576.1 hypothetical protein NDK47_04555 [Brevibacillus ruminantium]
MDFILTHKWAFLIAAEVIFWVSVITFLIARYWFGKKALSAVFLLLFILNDLWIATLGFFDYLQTGQFSSYQIIVVVLFLYAITYGKSDFKKLDYYVQIKVAKWKGLPAPDIEAPKKLVGREHAKRERSNLYVHLSVYVAAHLVFFFLVGLSPRVYEMATWSQFFTEFFSAQEALLPFQNETLNNLSRVWTLILGIDTVISLSYTVFPKGGSSSSSA